LGFLNKCTETEPDKADWILKYIPLLHSTIVDKEGIHVSIIAHVQVSLNEIMPAANKLRSSNRSALRQKHLRIISAMEVAFNSSMFHNYHDNKLLFCTETFNYLKYLNRFQSEPIISCWCPEYDNAYSFCPIKLFFY
jgi:hypothetical protein